MVVGNLDAHPLAHGISTRDRALKDCNACHAEDSRLSDDYVVASYLPGGSPPRPPEGARVVLAGTIAPLRRPEGSSSARPRSPRPGALHVLGHSRRGWTTGSGSWSSLSGSAGGHRPRWSSLRAPRRKRSPLAHPTGEKEYVFGRYERLWHWTMALTRHRPHRDRSRGARYPGKWALMSLTTSVAIDNAFAVILIVNAFLALFYHLATAAIRNFIPHPKGFLASAFEHMTYQARGIFYGRVTSEERRRPEAQSPATDDVPGAPERALPDADPDRGAHLGGGMWPPWRTPPAVFAPSRPCTTSARGCSWRSLSCTSTW